MIIDWFTIIMVGSGGGLTMLWASPWHAMLWHVMACGSPCYGMRNWTHPHLCTSQCVAVCCSVLQCVAVCCSVLQCVAVCYCVLPCAHGGVAEMLHWLRACAYGIEGFKAYGIEGFCIGQWCCRVVRLLPHAIWQCAAAWDLTIRVFTNSCNMTLGVFVSTIRVFKPQRPTHPIISINNDLNQHQIGGADAGYVSYHIHVYICLNTHNIHA